MSLSMPDAAYAASLWASGKSQRKIGAMIGLSTPLICIAIGRFIDEYSPTDFELSEAGPGLNRRNIVPLALKVYAERHGTSPDSFSGPIRLLVESNADDLTAMVLALRETKTRGELLAMPLAQLPLSFRTVNTLEGHYTTMGSVLDDTEEELMRTPGFGPVGLAEVKSVFGKLGFPFGRPGRTAPPRALPKATPLPPAPEAMVLERLAALERKIDRVIALLIDERA